MPYSSYMPTVLTHDSYFSSYPLGVVFTYNIVSNVGISSIIFLLQDKTRDPLDSVEQYHTINVRKIPTANICTLLPEVRT